MASVRVGFSLGFLRRGGFPTEQLNPHGALRE
jgi:hypothetical protein